MTEARYAICFDFPELEGEPLFAVWRQSSSGIAFGQGALGIEGHLGTAAKFLTEDLAEHWLKHCFVDEVAACGTVVEVGSWTLLHHTPLQWAVVASRRLKALGVRARVAAP